jgi:PAS domain-containing protein
MVGMHYDVTAKHDAEEARRISQEKFESIFQTLPDAAGISRISDGLFLEINPAYTETVGYTRAEALGRTSAELQVWANAQELGPWSNTISATATWPACP